MHPCRLGDRFRPGGSDEPAVGEDDVRAEDDFVDARHQREDGRVRDQDDGDAGRGEGFLEVVGGQVVLGVLVGLARHGGVGGFVVVGECFGVDDGEFASGGCFEEELLHGDGGGVGHDDLVGVDVVEGVAGDLVVDLGEFVDDFFDRFDYFRAQVLGCVKGCKVLRRERGAADRGVTAWRCGCGGWCLRAGE